MTLTTPILRLLVVDDNPGDRALIIHELRQVFPQLQAEEILNAADFAQALDRNIFNLVITDYQLRWTTGTEILRAVKRRDRHCPVIMFTATGNEEIAVEAMKAGLDDYVLKDPNRFIRLPAAVQIALERAANQRRAAQLEIQFRKLLERLTVGVFRADATGELLECNPVFLNLLGAETIEQARSMQVLDLQQIYMRLLNQPSTAQQWEMQLQRADGTTIWVLLNVVLSLEEESRENRPQNEKLQNDRLLDGLLEDITPRKQAELELRQLTETLERRVRERTAEVETSNRRLRLANQALEQFAYSISHDLREPLRSIQGFSQVLLESLDDQLNAENRLFLNQVLQSAQQADQLIQDLLSYSQLSRIEIPLQPINLSLLMPEILGQLQPEIQRRQAQIRVDHPLGEVMANRAVLTQVLMNLLSNAMKFVDPNQQPQIRVWTEVMEPASPSPADAAISGDAISGDAIPADAIPGDAIPGDTAASEPTSAEPSPSPVSPMIRLWVEDNGIGIAQEYHQRIFNVFVRLHGSEVYPGTGIGLATVYRGIERLGGRTGVRSQIGQGSQFWIELPLFQADC